MLAAGLMVSALASVLLARWLTRPIRALQEGAERIDAGAVPVRPPPLILAPLLERLLQGQAAAARRKGLRLALQVARPHGPAAGDAPATGLAVLSDPLLLERVITNLLGNAVRYTAQGGVLVAARQRGAGVQVAVIDSGIGIAEDPLNLVFREFYRAPGPAAVLCDLRLGAGPEGADRLALALEIQARHRLPVAIVSGETSADRVQAVRNAGLPLLTKPLRPARLRAQFEAMPGHSQAAVSASTGRS